MWNEQTKAACQAVVAPASNDDRPSWDYSRVETVVKPWSMLAKRGRGTIRLAPIEFRILRLLASRPNQVFTPRRIVEAVNSNDCLLTETTLRHYVASLRDQLGFFSDYIQTVPYIGYRFKA